MTHPLFGPEVRLMLQEDDTAGIEAFCETLHPATAAEAQSGEFEADDVWRFLQHASIANLAIEMQVKLVEGGGRQHMARLIERMSHDDRADLLRRLPPPVAEGLLRLVDEAD